MFRSIKEFNCVTVTTITGLCDMTYGFYLESWYLYENNCGRDDRFLQHMACPRVKSKGSFTLNSWHYISKRHA